MIITANTTVCTPTDCLLTEREGMCDISAITSLPEKVNKPFPIWGEMPLKGCINSISFIKAKVKGRAKGEN